MSPPQSMVRDFLVATKAGASWGGRFGRWPGPSLDHSAKTRDGAFRSWRSGLRPRRYRKLKAAMAGGR